MNEYDYVDLETLVAKARMERSIAIGNSIASFVGLLSNACRGVFGALGDSHRSGDRPAQAASGR